MAARIAADIFRRFPTGFALEAAFESGDGVTILFGPSGAGKTTILRCLAGLDHPDGGRITCGEEVWFDAARRIALPPQRRRAGYLFQDHALFPHLSVRKNIRYGISDLGRSARDDRVDEIAALAGVSELLERSPRALSGGERQRVALARALAPRPQVLLLDEPLSAIDAPSRERLRGVLRSILKQSGIPVVLVTHDRDEALALGDRMVLVAGGRVEQSGAVDEVFSRPANVTVAEIVGVETVAPGRIVSSSAGLATVRVGAAELAAVAPDGADGDVFVCLRAEDVTLERGARPESSARNRLPCRVVALDAAGSLVRVALDCGFPLAALVTKLSSEQLALSPGAEVTAVVKAQAVHVIPRT